MADKITQVYNAYKADGATRAKSEQQFRNWMYGDNYRRGVWNDLRKQGASVGTFEHFTEALGYKMNPKVKSKVAKQAIQYGAPKVPDNWGQAFTSNNILGSFANDKTFTPTLKKKDAPALMFRESELGGGYVLDYGKKDPKTGEVSIELDRKIRDDADREAQKLNQQIIESLSEGTKKRARKKQRETIRKEMGYASTDANEGMGALFGGIRRANIEHGTENEYVDAYHKAMNTPEFKSKVDEAAKKAGVDPEYLYNNHVLPRAKEDIRNHLIESGTPKSTADYIMQGALDGIAGNMFKRGLMTADQRTIMDEATAKKAEQIDDERKKNGFFSTATLTSAGRTAMGMAADAAAFAGAGKIAGGMMSGLSYGVNLITKTPLGKRLFGSVIGTSAKALEKKFGAEGAARIANFVGNNNGFWKTLLTTGSKNTMQSGLTLANYNVMQYMTGEGYDKMGKGTTLADYIIGMVDAGNSGFKTGLLFGAVGSVGGTLGRNVGITGTEANMIERLKHGVRKAAVKTGTFVAESLAFRTEQMAEEWAKDNKINFVDNFVEGALENLSIKLGSAMGGGKVAHFSPSRIMRGLVFAEGNSGLKLTKEERSEFMSNTKAKSLLEACEALEPNHKTQGEGLAMEVSTPVNSQSSYEARQETANKKQIDLSERTPGGQAVGKLQQFLDDKTISWTLRQKVAAALGGTMSNSRPRTDRVSVTENGGKFSVSEYSKDDELLSSKEYNDKDGAEAAKQEIYLKRQDRDFKNAYLSAMRISTEDEKQECIEKVAEELGYKSAAEMLLESARRSEEGDNELDKEIGDAYKRIAEQMEGAKAKRVLDIQREVGEEFGVDFDKAMDKDYSKRNSVEEQAIEEFKKRLTGLSEDKNDIEQLTTTASQEGSDLAEQTDIEDSTDFTEKAQAVNDRQASAHAAWDELVKANPDLEEWMKSNPDFDISDLRENFGDAVADTWAEVHASDSMKAGFVDHVGQSIEDVVKNQVGQAKFTGTMQDKEGVEVAIDNSVTVFADKDGNEYTLVGGDVIVDTAGDGSYSAGKSGLVIFRDKDGNLVQRTNFDGLNEVGTFSLEDYANRIRTTLQEKKTAEIQSSEQPKVEAPKEETPKGKTIIEGVEPEEKPTAKEEPKKEEAPKDETSKTEAPANGMPKIPETPKEETPKENQSESENEPPKAEGPQPLAEPKEESNYMKNDIPMDSEGEPIYEQVSKERTAQDLFDKLGDGNVAHDYAQIRIEGAEKELKEAKKKEPKIGAKINEYLKNKQEYDDRVKAAEDKVAYWESVKDEIEKLTHTTPEELKEAPTTQEESKSNEKEKSSDSNKTTETALSQSEDYSSDGKDTTKSSDSQGGNETLTFKDGTEVPMDDKGEPDFSKMTPEHGAELYEKNFGSDAESTLASEKKAAEKALKDANKMKISGEGWSKKVRAKKDKETAIASAQAEIDRIDAIQKALTSKKVAETMRDKTETTSPAEANVAGGVPAEKFSNAPKVTGRKGTRTLTDGTKISGTYMIVPAESLTPSHDVGNGYKKSEGFPVNKEGRTINDRDYEQDRDAQDVTDKMSADYDGQAVNQVPTVSDEGIVYDGNGRTMAGQIAAKRGTDGKYIEALRENAEGFGIKPEDIDKIEHPRVVFVPDERLPYDTETFSRFNKNEKKTQSNTQEAIANSKKLSPEDIGSIVGEIENSGSLDSFFNSPKAIKDMLKTLVEKGVIGQNEIAGMMDGDLMSAKGKEFIHNLLLGSVFKEDTLKMLGIEKGLKSKALIAIRPILETMKLGEYSLRDEVNHAIQLLYEAKRKGNKVDTELRTSDMFGEDASERYSKAEQILAKALEGKVGDFRELIEQYNENCKAMNTGEESLFNDKLTKEEFINEILKLENWKKYETRTARNEGEKGRTDVRGSESGEQETRGNNEEGGKGGLKPADPSDVAEGMRGAAEQFHEERVEKARKAYEESKASGDASETKRTKDEYRKALDDKLKAQGIGLIERRKTIAKEIGEEPKVEKPKGEGPKVGEKQWEDMTPTERAEKADADPLTEDEIRSDEDNKELAAAAIAYLNGDKSLLNQIAYLKIYGNVRSRHEDVPGNSGTEDKTQLAAADNGGGEGMELESGRGSGGTVEPMDRGAGGEAAPGKQEGGETGKGDTDTPAGEGSNSEGKGETPGLGGLPSGSGGRKGSGTAGSTGSVGSGRGRGSGSRPSKSNGKRKPAAKQGTSFPNSKGRDVRQETKDAKAAMMAAFAEFKKRGKKGSVSISLVGLNNEQIEYLPEMAKATGRYGIALIGEGIYRAKEWIRNVREAITDQMKDCGFSDTDIDEYIREMWHMPWEMDGETHKIGEWASIKGYANLRESLKEPLRKKFDKQVLAEATEVKVGDRKNIEETLPFLLPQQQDDVLKAETQFFDESHKDKAHAGGKGYMFTNGTGTGKTYTGLGIIKRMVKQGKERILIITPSQQKVKDWINDGKNLCLDIRDLDDWANERGSTATNEKGDGVVITTFANFGTNKRLLEDQFDAIVYDESHRIMENKNATETARSRQHYMLSNRNESYALMRLEEINPDCMKMRGLAEDFEDARKKEVERIQAEYRKEHPSENEKEMRLHTSKSLPKDIHSFSISDKAKFPELGKIYEDYIKARDYYINNVKPKLEKQAKESVDKTKVVFLSATPFNTRENIEYAEGYLFSYPERNDMGQSGKTQFFLEHFGAGYKYRYHRLESSTSNAEALAKQEIAFSDWLQNDLGTMSGRVIDSPFDYSRDFPTVSVEHADEFNTACEEISRDKIFGDAYRKVLGDYNYGSALFETMKVSALLPRLREHLAAGRKIVIFHRRVTSKEPLKAPFGMILGEQAEQTIKALPKEKQPEARIHLNELRDKYSGLLEWEKTLDFSMPREQLAKAFGEDNILYFSGSESKSVKSEAVKQFNDDNSGKNIIVIQEASGKEGISLHDTTGKHQRVCITLALPQSPITALQIEGRTYRIGNESNAIFEYPVLGLTSEYNLFASKFNRQVSTTENLALGNQARNLRDSFARGIEEHSGIVPIDQQGVGGKEFDKGDVSENDPFDNAVLDYYTNQRLNKNNREGVDYFPTPEPLGYKMVEWANIGEGDSVLEPSAGHGAIARYVPQSNELVAIEPSMSLFAKLQMKAGGLGRKFQNETFEAYHISNKHDTIVMNPPFGHAGATAIAHIEKAFGHLEEGGRMVAIIPRGAMDKKFDKWYDNEKTAAMRAEVDLPDIVFQQAGTSVRCRVVVVDKITDSKLREQAHMEKADLSGHYDKIEDFFNDLRGVEVPDRIIDTNFKMQKMSKSAVKSLKEIRDVWSADVDKDGVHVRTSSWMGYDISFTGSEDPKRWKDKMAATYDKYAQMEKSELREGNKAVFGELKELACKLAGMTEDEMRRYLVSKGTGGVRFRTSDELFKEYGPRWIDEQTNEDGRHTTQVKNTINSYKKFGEFVKEDSNGRNVDVLDASSGLGLGTEWMRENGMNVDDVEPFPSKDRTAPTYTKYDDVKKKYDYIISNAVLNVIPDDWRANVLHDMADKLKVGGKLVINVRGAQSIKTQGTEGKTRTTLDDPSEILVHRPDGSIKAYQKGFTKEELRDWCKQELGEDYSVEIANKKNAGGSYDTAVVVKKEKEGTRFRKGEDLTPEERRAEKRMEEHNAEVSKAAEKLNTKVNVCVDINDVTNAEARAAIERGEKVKAWYDTRTGEVHVYLPNVTDKYDAQMSVAHEVVAHKGMRGLLGEEGYRSMMRRMYTHLSNEEVKEVNERMMRNGWDFYTAMDEWVADKAEESVFTPKYVVMKVGLHRYPLDKVFHIVTEALHNVGYRINPNVDDVKYWLWESKKGLKNGDAYTTMKRNSFLWRLNHNTSNDGIENGEFVKTGGNNMSDEQSREAVLFRKQSLDRSKNDTPLMSSTKDSIDKALNNWNSRRIECFTDDKHGLRVFQQELAKGLKKGMNDSMDSYHGAINQSSIVREKQYQFETRELKTMNDAVKECTRKLGGGMEGYEELNKYAYVKSGLERNRVLFVRDAAEQVDKKIMKLNKEALDKDPQAVTLAKMGVEEFRDAFHSEKKFQETLLNSGKISLAEYYKALDDFIKDFSFQHTGDAEKDALIDKLNDWYADKIGGKYDENENDYSGIRKFDDFDSDAERIDYVMNTEATLGEESKNKLWQGIGGVTHFAIDNDYNYGVIGKDVHNRVSSMFSWYIPMRGFKEDTMEDMYAYLNNEISDGGNVSSVVKRADGRTTLADSPFGTAAALAERSISNGEDNRNKQRLYRLVNQWLKDHTTTNEDGKIELTEEAPAVISEVWYKKVTDNTTGETYWEAVMPDIDGEKDPKQIRAKVERFEENMRNAEKNGNATRTLQKGTFAKPFNVAKHKNEHVVFVNVNGKQKMIIMQGNPRPAQAINGDTASDVTAGRLMRGMSSMFTSYNITFSVTNTSRDTFFANNNVAIREDAAYYARFVKNQALMGGSMLQGAVMMNMPKVKGMYYQLWSDYKKGKKLTGKYGKYFEEYMNNGGKTGFVQTKTIEDLEKHIRNEATQKMLSASTLSKVMSKVPEVIEALNERSENMNRFACYVTSREMGRSVMRSVSDAKEVSTNFNRKGSGSKAFKGTDAKALEKWQGWLYDRAKSFYLFFNAGMQSLSLLSNNLSRHPVKTAAFAVGIPILFASSIIPAINSWIASCCDEDDQYDNLSEWERRNNICIYAGHSNWVKVPLPIELRAFYGFGDVALGVTNPAFRSEKGLWLDMLSQMTQILPLDFMGEGGDVIGSLIPDVTKPLYHVMVNRDWTGKPIYKDYDYLKYEPEYQKVFQGENEWFVSFSKFINEMSGGNEHVKGSLDGKWNNPAIWGEIINGYGGGALSDAIRTGKMATRVATWNWEDFSTREVPMVRALYSSATEKTKYYRSLSKYAHYKEDADKYLHDFKANLKSDNPLYVMKAISDMKRESPEFVRMVKIHGFEKSIKNLKKIANNEKIPKKARDEAKELINQEKVKLVKEFESDE